MSPSCIPHRTGIRVDLSDSEVRIDLWKTLKDQRSAIKICDITSTNRLAH